jgi:hypothetical protein
MPRCACRPGPWRGWCRVHWIWRWSSRCGTHWPSWKPPVTARGLSPPCGLCSSTTSRPGRVAAAPAAGQAGAVYGAGAGFPAWCGARSEASCSDTSPPAAASDPATAALLRDEADHARIGRLDRAARRSTAVIPERDLDTSSSRPVSPRREINARCSQSGVRWHRVSTTATRSSVVPGVGHDYNAILNSVSGKSAIFAPRRVRDWLNGASGPDRI